MFHNHIAQLAILLFYIFNFQILRKKSMINPLEKFVKVFLNHPIYIKELLIDLRKERYWKTVVKCNTSLQFLTFEIHLIW